MYAPHSQGQSKPGMLGALNPIAGLFGLAGSVIYTPRLWPQVEGHVRAILYESYSPDISIWLYWAAYLLLFPVVFVAIRTGIMASATAMTLILIRRLM